MSFLTDVLSRLNDLEPLPADIKQDMVRPEFVSYVAALEKEGYSIGDAAMTIFYTSDSLDEAYALGEQDRIARKYKK